GLEGIDLTNGRAVLLEQPFVTAAEDTGEDIDHGLCRCRRGRKKQGVRTASPLLPSELPGDRLRQINLGIQLDVVVNRTYSNIGDSIDGSIGSPASAMRHGVRAGNEVQLALRFPSFAPARMPAALRCL